MMASLTGSLSLRGPGAARTVAILGVLLLVAGLSSPDAAGAPSASALRYDATSTATTALTTSRIASFGGCDDSGSTMRTRPCASASVLAAKAVGGSNYPRFISAGGEIIDTASPALKKQIDDVADAIVATGRPPVGVRHGGLPGKPGVYGNKGGQLPSRREGYYTESDVWAGTGPRGTERIIVGRKGEVWYTPDHYGTFRRIR